MAKTKNQEGRPCATICSWKKSGEREGGRFPLLDVAGGDEEVAGKGRNNGWVMAAVETHVAGAAAACAREAQVYQGGAEKGDEPG